MTGPNMAAITAALERSLQNCSLNNQNHSQSRAFFTGERSSSSDDNKTAAVPSMEEGQNRNFQVSSSCSSSDTTLELNSHVSLPYHWEQCLDLKTGEIYYINWKTGMKSKEDPRTTASESTDEEEEYNINGELYSEEGEEEEEEEESSCESEESSSEHTSPLPSCSRQEQQEQEQEQQNYRQIQMKKREEQVLVVAGCKGCLMYFMVPKQVEDCPKCNGQLLHFDRSESASL